MTLDDWINIFQPIPNPGGIGFEVDDQNFMFETYGTDLNKVLLARYENPRTVWTLVEADDASYIIEGYHHVNRVGYFVTRETAPQKEITVPFQ